MWRRSEGVLWVHSQVALGWPAHLAARFSSLLSGGDIWFHASTATAADPVKIGALTEAWGPNPQMLGLRDGLRDWVTATTWIS